MHEQLEELSELAELELDEPELPELGELKELIDALDAGEIEEGTAEDCIADDCCDVWLGIPDEGVGPAELRAEVPLPHRTNMMLAGPGRDDCGTCELPTALDVGLCWDALDPADDGADAELIDDSDDEEDDSDEDELDSTPR